MMKYYKGKRKLCQFFEILPAPQCMVKNTEKSYSCFRRVLCLKNESGGLTMEKKNKKRKLNFNKLLVAFSLLPMIISASVMLVMLIGASSNEMKGVTEDSMVSLVRETGAGFESYIENGEAMLLNFSKSPIVNEYLEYKEDAALRKEALQIIQLVM